MKSDTLAQRIAHLVQAASGQGEFLRKVPDTRDIALMAVVIGAQDCNRGRVAGHAALADGRKEDQFLLLHVHLHLANHAAEDLGQTFGIFLIAVVEVLDHFRQLGQLHALPRAVARFDVACQFSRIVDRDSIGHHFPPSFYRWVRNRAWPTHLGAVRQLSGSATKPRPAC